MSKQRFVGYRVYICGMPRPAPKPKRTSACAACKPRDWSADMLNHAAHADKRLAAGMKQAPCPECRLWRWPDELPRKKGGIR